MKLASLKDGSRDGQLIVVSRDLKKAHVASPIANTLQQALDDWPFIAPQLLEISDALNSGRSKYPFDFEPKRCTAPLPRAYQWCDGSAYVNHFELLMQARGEALPDFYYNDPCIYQGGADDFLGPCDPASFATEDWGIDFEAELAVITTDVPMGATAERAAQSIVLVGLLNDWSLRHLVPSEWQKHFGFFQSKPATAFAPVFVTPDELGAAWANFVVHLPVLVHWNGKKVGQANAGEDVVFNFAQLLAHAAKTRNLRPGSIVGGGTISNKNSKAGYSCIAEARARETISDGKPISEYMRFQDHVRIEVLNADGSSVFGCIDQQVVALPSD